MLDMKTTLLILFISLFLSKQAYCTPTDSLILSDALQSNMVLQQNKPFKVWGTAKANTEVSIQGDWMTDPVKVFAGRDGRFLGIIDVPEAKQGDFTAHVLKINSVNNKIVLSNLLIGDLWFCSGQSNMQFAVKEMTGAAAELADADQPHIRLLNVALNFSAQPVEKFKGNWQVCSPETVKKFSAVGYSFGKKLYEQLQIPIGLIFTGIGASGVQAYVPQEVLSRDTMLNRVYLDPYLKSPKSRQAVDSGFSFEKVVRPFLLYNAMIYPFLNLSIKGFCWYQGESNDMERASYTRATQKMIEAWRYNFKQDNLPFLYVQIAPFFHDKEDPGLNYDAFFREAQERVGELDHTEMVLTMDVGEAKNLHPKNKKPVGIRLANTALNRVYGMLDVPYRGPHYAYIEIKKRNVMVHFTPETVGEGLATNDGKAPRFFYLAGEDHVFYPAEASLVENEVLVRSKKVKHPVAVRYAFFNYPVTNLQNKAGFPAVPFRTDNWTESK
jgi:sialate O-acetylesterase